MAEIVQGLWIGDRLSTMEQLSIASFLAHGHPFHLYTYGEVAGVPAGTVVRDAEEILPASRIFSYTEEQSYAGFANWFRYQLLLERGGWWVDVDVVCLASFDALSELVVATEETPRGPVPTVGMLRAPAGSALMAEAAEICAGKDPSKLRWGETGSRLMTELLRRHGLEDCLLPPEVFCPLSPDQWVELLDPRVVVRFGDATRALHLWRQLWRAEGVDPDGDHPPDCLYRLLQKRYLAAD